MSDELQANHAVLTAFLAKTGWANQSAPHAPLQVYTKEINGEPRQVDVPTRTDCGDYGEAMRQAVEELAAASGLTVPRLLAVMRDPEADVLTVRIASKSIKDGNLDVDRGISFYTNIKRLLAAAALDVVMDGYEKYHAGRGSSQIDGFVKKCRYGQTEIGSYLATVVCPAGAEPGGLTRKVVKKIIDGMRQIADGMNRGLVDEQFATEHRMSGNFLNALCRIGIEDENDDLTVGAAYSPLAPEPDGTPSEATFKGIYREQVMGLGARLRQESAAGMEEYTGLVNSLKASPQLQNRDGGEISFSYLDKDGKAKKAKVHLNKDDYAAALQAHAQGLYVTIRGCVANHQFKQYAGFRLNPALDADD